MPLAWSCGTIMCLMCEKVASNFGLGDGFRRVLRFPPSFTTGYSRIIRKMAEKMTKNRNSKSKFLSHADVTVRQLHITPPPPPPTPSANLFHCLMTINDFQKFPFNHTIISLLQRHGTSSTLFVYF